MEINSQSIQDIIDGSHTVTSIKAYLRKLIIPKPIFIKGEVFEFVNNEGNVELAIVNRIDDYYLNATDTNNYLKRDCRKLKETPIAMIPWNSPDRPSELEDKDFIIFISDTGQTTGFKAEGLNWRAVKYYAKVNLLGVDDEKD